MRGLIICLLVAVILLFTCVKINYKVNRLRFPNAPAWTAWW